MNKHAFAAVGAGALWGAIGLFTKNLSAMGFGMWDLVAVRCGISALCFAVMALFTEPKQLKIKLKDLWCFIGLGVVSMLFFTYCYFTAIELTGMSTASILLYTAPCFVMVLSLLCFGDRIGRRGFVSLLLCFAGVFLVSGGGGQVTFRGVVFGLGAGIGYAFFSIFSRAALNRGYGSTAINFYAGAIASAGAFCIAGVAQPVRLMVSSAPALLLSLGLGVLICFLPYLLYTYSLTGISNGQASIMASVEPVVATLISVSVFHERLTVMAICGIALVLAAIVCINRR